MQCSDTRCGYKWTWATKSRCHECGKQIVGACNWKGAGAKGASAWGPPPLSGNEWPQLAGRGEQGGANGKGKWKPAGEDKLAKLAEWLGRGSKAYSEAKLVLDEQKKSKPVWQTLNSKAHLLERRAKAILLKKESIANIQLEMQELETKLENEQEELAKAELEVKSIEKEVETARLAVHGTPVELLLSIDIPEEDSTPQIKELVAAITPIARQLEAAIQERKLAKLEAKEADDKEDDLFDNKDAGATLPMRVDSQGGSQESTPEEKKKAASEGAAQGSNQAQPPKAKHKQQHELDSEQGDFYEADVDDILDAMGKSEVKDDPAIRQEAARLLATMAKRRRCG